MDKKKEFIKAISNCSSSIIGELQLRTIDDMYWFRVNRKDFIKFLKSQLKKETK